MKTEIDYHQIGQDVESSLATLRRLYPLTASVDVWVKLQGYEVEYTACVRQNGGFQCAISDNPAIAIDKLIEIYPPKSDEQVKAERIAQLTAEIDKLKG